MIFVEKVAWELHPKNVPQRVDCLSLIKSKFDHKRTRGIVLNTSLHSHDWMFGGCSLQDWYHVEQLCLCLTSPQKVPQKGEDG